MNAYATGRTQFLPHIAGSLACLSAVLARQDLPVWLAGLYLAFSSAHFWYRIRFLTPGLLHSLAGWSILLLGGIALPERPKAFALFLILQVLVFEVLRPLFLENSEKERFFGSVDGIQKAFFLSGFSALIYQVAWQRRLIELVGGDSESVAVIIAIFMGGLGLGSLLADILIKRFSRYGLLVFCFFEIGIGTIGLLSIPLLDHLAATLASVPQGAGLIAFVSFVLLPPTVLMGATLPVLAEILKKKLPLFNETVGRLYAVNALGSAMASLATALLLFGVFGVRAVTAFAAICNGATAWMIWVGAKSWAGNIEKTRPEPHPSPEASAFTVPAIAFLALLTGLTTLAQEVLLLKQAAWISGGRAETFGMGVGVFLLGLAGGSWKQIHTPRRELCPTAATHWAITAAAFSALPFLSPYLVVPGVPLLFVYLLLGVCGYFGARTLPMVTGLLHRDDQPKLGRIVAANIVGSVAGALLIGNALVDVAGLAASIQIVAALSLLICLLFAWASYADGRKRVSGARPEQRIAPRLLLFSGLSLFGLAASPFLADKWLERMLLVSANPEKFVFVAESKSGIVAVNRESGALIVYGGGVYDGAVNTHLTSDTNEIARLYRFLGLHDAPGDVLEIGLSSGSWARVIAQDERVRKIVSIEINPAYRRLVAAFPEVAPVLADPKFELHIDDGRRWLMANRGAKFDLIVSNTSFHWRAGATVITSKEFMALAKGALRPGGILLMNTTGSPNIVATALAVFPHVAMIRGLVIASMSPIDTDPERAIARLAAHPNIASARAARGLVGSAEVRVVTAQAPNTVVVEDDAMNEEFGNVPVR